MSANQQLPFIMARCNQRPLPFAGKGVWGVAAVAVIAGVLSLPGWSWMSLDATSLALGEWWTLWTGHFRHWTFAHFFWDWTLFVVCLWILRNEGKVLLGGVLVTLPILSLGVFLLRPDLFEYRGLSGIDTVLFARIASGILVSCLRQRNYGALFWLGAIAPLVGLGAKIGWELQTGGALFSGDLGPGNVVVPEVHWMGFLMGILWTLCGGGKAQGRCLEGRLRCRKRIRFFPLFPPRPSALSAVISFFFSHREGACVTCGECFQCLVDD